MGANQAPGRGHGGFACRIALPLWVPGGGHNGFGRRSIFYFSRFSAPIPPTPLPGGKGESQSLFRRGLRPRHPGIKPFAALTESAERVPCAWEPAVRRKTERTAFLWAVPAAKERGDRGRGTSAFEMVLSPGAGRTSAVGVQSPPPGTTEARSAGNTEGTPPCRAPQRQGQPATRKARPPTRYFFPHTGFSFRIAYNSQ